MIEHPREDCHKSQALQTSVKNILQDAFKDKLQDSFEDKLQTQELYVELILEEYDYCQIF